MEEQKCPRRLAKYRNHKEAGGEGRQESRDFRWVWGQRVRSTRGSTREKAVTLLTRFTKIPEGNLKGNLLVPVSFYA